MNKKIFFIWWNDDTLLYAEDVFGTGMMKGRRGIYTATGVCTCDDIGKCTCEKKTQGVLKSRKTTQEYKDNNKPSDTG